MSDERERMWILHVLFRGGWTRGIRVSKATAEEVLSMWDEVAPMPPKSGMIRVEGFVSFDPDTPMILQVCVSEVIAMQASPANE